MDEPIYKLMSQFRYENVELYRIPDIDSADLITYRVGNDYQHFCWCLASYFTYWLRSVKEIGDIMYMDADLYFFNDYAPIFEEIGQKSIGIITHRFPNDRERKVGKYNVGIIYFKNDETGTNCLLWWKNVVMNPENPYYKTHSTCGDQKYLELFEPLYGKGNIQVIDKIGHLAAWNIHDHTFDDDINNIYWKGVRQTLIFCHFSHFQADLSKDYYKTNYNGEWRPETVTGENGFTIIILNR